MKRKVFSLILAVLMLMAAMAGCSENPTEAMGGSETPATGTNTESGGDDNADSADSVVTDKVKNEDTDSDWSADNATLITLTGESAEIAGEGAAVSGGTVTITKAGVYVVSDTLAKGQIVINAGKDDVVRLVLNGADITAAQNAAIYGTQADKLIVILAEGTSNSITDAGASFVYADTAAEEPDAALFSKIDLSICGEGSLTVNAGFYNGIGTKDDLIISAATLTVKAANHGIRGRDSLTVLSGTINITAGNDGLQSNNDEDSTKGWIKLSGGVLDIHAAHDGVQAETDMLITGGEFTITTGNGTVGTSSDSYKGLKAGGLLDITGGSFVIDSTDDCIHAGGHVTVTGGTLTLSSGDDGMHSDADMTIDGGTIDILKSYEGIEGLNVYIKSGNITLVSSDDAINAAGGNDSGTGGFFGRDNFRGGGGDYLIDISGGEIHFVAGGDGLDSNGDIHISGGVTTALIRSTRDNEAMDCDGSFVATGGIVIYGGTGAGQTPGNGSTQSYVYTSGSMAAGTEIALKKGDTTLLTFTPVIDCQYLSISAPDIVSGESYSFHAGDSSVTATAGTGGGTGMGGGMGGGPGGGGRR